MIKKIATNTIAQVLSKASTAIISIFLIKVLTNYLDIEGYGLYSKIYNYLGIFAFLADLGLYTIGIREISNNKENAEKIAGNILTLRTITGLAIILVAFIVGLFMPGYNSILALSSIIIVGLFTVVSLINSSILSAMHAFLQSEKSIISVIAGKLVNIGFVLFIVYSLFPKGSGYNEDFAFLLIMSAGFFGVGVMALMNYYFSKDVLKIRFKFDFDYIKYIFKISLPYGLALFLSTLYTKVDLVLLSLFEEGSKGDISVALYNVPLKIVDVAMFFGIMFLSSMLPFLTKYRNNKEKLTSIVGESFKILTSLGLIFVSLGVLFRDNIITLIANSDYVNHEIYKYTSSDAMMIVLFMLLFYFISQLFIYILIASERQSDLLKINIWITVFNVVGNIILIPYYSFVGAGIVTVLSQLILSILVYRKVKGKVYKVFDFKYLFVSVVLSVFVYLLGYNILLNFPLSNLIDVILYGGILFLIYTLILYKLFFKKSIKELKSINI